MKEYMVKITEIRYEYIEAETTDDAIEIAREMALTNADETKFEIVEEDDKCFVFADELCKNNNDRSGEFHICMVELNAND